MKTTKSEEILLFKNKSVSYTITCFMGKQRSCKTMSAVRMTEQILFDILETIKYLENKPKLNNREQKKLEVYRKFELWSNLDLDKNIFGYYRKITPIEIMNIYLNDEKIKNKIILLDDLFKNMDSRKHESEQNIALSYFTTEIGKARNILIYVSHFSHRVEKRLKEMTENFIWCRKGELIDLKFEYDSKEYIIKEIFVESEDYYKSDYTKKEINNMVCYQKCYRDYIDFSEDIYNPEKEVVWDDCYKIKTYFNHYDTGEVQNL